uniref:UPAR/Ly6 domain-containing protein n=1 Tax=Caenorhabditis japonica TaxID=281687 RepID=A0A8R1DMY6_CAEJA
MRFLHPPLLLLLFAFFPASVSAVECLNYRVPQGQPIPKAVRNPRCNSKAEYCVKITGTSLEGSHPFIAGRCEYVEECKIYGKNCFTRSDAAGKTEEVCCSNENFSNQSSLISVNFFIASIFITFYFLAL